jgi:hypothetical protein
MGYGLWVRVMGYGLWLYVWVKAGFTSHDQSTSITLSPYLPYLRVHD